MLLTKWIEKENKKQKQKENIKQLGYIYIAAFLGAALALLGNIIFIEYQKNEERKALASALYIDVRNKEASLYRILSKLPYQKAINAKIIDFNIHSEVYDALLPKFLLLSEEDLRTAIKFYGVLDKVNQAKMLFIIEGINKKEIIDNLYDNVVDCLVTAHKLIKAFEKEYAFSLKKVDQESLNKLKKEASDVTPEVMSRIDKEINPY